jgi:hypothetical protein
MDAIDRAKEAVIGIIDIIGRGKPAPHTTKVMMNLLVNSIIEAVKEDIDNSGEYVKINTECGTIQPREPEPCSNCMNREPGAVIRLKGIFKDPKCADCGRSLEKEWLRMFTSKPTLIQGYTAEQWQEIIDGGYFCEFGIFGDTCSSRFGILKKIDGSRYVDERGIAWINCRPAQIKGVMRPIWVEPVDKMAKCNFFGEDGRFKFFSMWDLRRAVGEHNLSIATSYIEL